MERTSITLGGVHLNSTVTNASGPRSATREELLELSHAHRGAVVFKSCNPTGLGSPDNLKNPGVEYYAALAGDLAPKGTIVWGSVVGVTEDEIVAVARRLSAAGASIIELNLADDFVANSVAPFKTTDLFAGAAQARAQRDWRRDARGESAAVGAARSGRRHRRRFQGDRGQGGGMRQRPSQGAGIRPRQGDRQGGARSAVADPCLLPGRWRQPGMSLVGGVSSGSEAYLAHLTGAKAVQVGSALIEEGVSAIGRIDQELDALLAKNGKASVTEIVGKVAFA